MKSAPCTYQDHRHCIFGHCSCLCHKSPLDAANVLYDLLHLPPPVEQLAAQVLGNAMLYLLMGDLYPGGYSRSALKEFYDDDSSQLQGQPVHAPALETY